jgi:hypothetical protein
MSNPFNSFGIMGNQNETANSGKKQTLDEVLEQLGYRKSDFQQATQEEILVAVLASVQRISVNLYGFMDESWDWFVALQWMQDHNQFKSNPKRPPFAAFKAWLHEHNVPQTKEQCSTRSLTHVNQKITGARYPWKGVMWEPNVLPRWRVMYRLMDRIWLALSSNE